MDGQTRKYKILVVDDSRSIGSRIRSALLKESYEVKTITNPVRAYEMIENEHFDIVISDIEMPEMNGLELLRKIKQFNGMTQVIIITGYITVNYTLNAFRYGAADLFFKPLELKQLIKAVKDSVLRREHIEKLLDHAVELKG